MVEFENYHTHYIGTGASVEVEANDSDNGIYAKGGNDTVVALGGNDWVEGNAGNDVLYGNDGGESVTGGVGNGSGFLGTGDVITGWKSSNSPSDMDGDDFIRGGAGDDIIINNFGSNFLLGDSDDDTILAVDGHSAADASVNEADFGTVDTHEGGAGDDRLIGDVGDVMIV